MKYIVMEIQIFKDGAISTPCYAYDDNGDGKGRKSAESKYYSILSAAAKSALPKCGASLLTEDGLSIMNGIYENKEITNEGQTASDI